MQSQWIYKIISQLYMQIKIYPSKIRLVKFCKSIKIFPPQHCYVITMMCIHSTYPFDISSCWTYCIPLLYVVYLMVVWPISQGLSKLNVHTKMVELSFYAYFLSKYFDFFYWLASSSMYCIWYIATAWALIFVEFVGFHYPQKIYVCS